MSAFALTSKERDRKSNIVDALRKAKENFEERVYTGEALEAYTAAVRDAEDFRLDIADYWREQWENKSERWADSDRGCEVNDFIEEWESAEFEAPEDGNLTQELNDDADTLENLPEEV